VLILTGLFPSTDEPIARHGPRLFLSTVQELRLQHHLDRRASHFTAVAQYLPIRTPRNGWSSIFKKYRRSINLQTQKKAESVSTLSRPPQYPPTTTGGEGDNRALFGGMGGGGCNSENHPVFALGACRPWVIYIYIYIYIYICIYTCAYEHIFMCIYIYR